MVAINEQVGGDHYKNMAYQPFEFAMDLGGLPAMCKVAKYLTRTKDDRMLNLRKAYHVINLEQDYLASNKGKIIYGEHPHQETIEGFELECINKFCSQFVNCNVYKTILSCILLGKYNKAKENLTKFIKYNRYAAII